MQIRGVLTHCALSAVRGLSNNSSLRYAENRSLFSSLYATALKEAGTLCLAVSRVMDTDGDDEDESEELTRVVIGAPDNDMILQPSDNIIALVQSHHSEKEKS